MKRPAWIDPDRFGLPGDREARFIGAAEDMHWRDESPAPPAEESESPPPTKRLDEPLSRALAQWERKALNRLAAGKSAACAFEDPALPPEAPALIQAALTGAFDAAAVRALFRTVRTLF